MNFFSNNPFIKLLGFWIIGILIAKYLPILLLAFIVWLIIGSIWFFKLYQTKRYPFDFIGSLLLASILILLSSLNFKLQHPSIPRLPNRTIEFSAIVLENPQEKGNSIQTVLRIEQADVDSLIGFKLLTWVQKDSMMPTISAGSSIFASTQIQSIENSGNPFEFDYKSYMALQGIHYCCYISKKGTTVLESKTRNLRLQAENFRERLLDQLRLALAKQESFEVISALTLGYRKELSPETRESFTDTGAMHVLAVSGLHVGLIFLFLLQLFKFLNRLIGGKWIKLIVISTFLWGYAMITGFSPSVQRATTMFTFLLVAETLNRRSSIYNSIAASAFALLLINPDILFAVGFQLSYAAVLSIVYFFPIMEKLLSSQNPFIKKPWQLLCVSLSAQIGTFPLSLYYFNQFPVYFWLSNFIVIPAAFALLSTTFLFFLTSAIPPLCHFIAFILDNTNSVLLYGLQKISKLPGAVVQQISISGWELTCLFAVIIFFVLFINFKKARYLQFGLLCFLCFLIIGLKTKFDLLDQHQVIVYKTKNQTIHFIDGRENYILSKDTAKLSNYLYGNVLTRLWLAPPIILPISYKTTYISNNFILNDDICQFGDQTFNLDELRSMNK